MLPAANGRGDLDEEVQAPSSSSSGGFGFIAAVDESSLNVAEVSGTSLSVSCNCFTMAGVMVVTDWMTVYS